MTLFCKLADLENESDVEQKLMSPMLTAAEPMGFGYLISDFRTKPNIRRFEIDKGQSAKLYYPDYIVVIQGLPLLIIEAKNPSEDVLEGFRDARLYAAELNSKFPSGINPCTKIIATNGKNLVYGKWDSDQPDIKVAFNEIDVVNPNYAQLISLVSKKTISDRCKSIYLEIRKERQLVKPLRILGGRFVQNEELQQNSFGATLALEHRYLFNPETIEDRRIIVRNAYVTSQKRLKYCQPIDRLIRAALPPSMINSTKIQDTGKPQEIFSKLYDHKRLKHALFLLVGSVGSGKSTFIDYLHEVALPKEVKDSTIWANIDLNAAPLFREEIYEWLKTQLISQLQTTYPDIDFEDLSILLKLYGVEIKKFEKGEVSLFPKDSLDYKRLLADELSKLRKDKGKSLNCLIRYLCGERGKLFIVALDNCDKRTRDDQLLMFDVAKWLQKEYECLVFLPIRDTTYDHHRKEPPLDTAVKDLVFRIDPPLLMDVIAKRIKYALKIMQTKDSKILTYSLPNGITIEYPQSDQGMYLSCILRSLFNNVFFRRLVSGIAGRDIRRGIEIFLNFCKSAYITEDHMFKIKTFKGMYNLPQHIITRVLLRGNRKYYRDENSFIKNLFNSYPEDAMPDPFLRMAILRWLRNRYRKPGPNNILGYHRMSNLLFHLASDGHSEDRSRREILSLLQAGCLITESQIIDEVSDEDLICLTPTGHVHLELLINLDYLSSCSEDVWYMNHEVASRIADRMVGKLGTGHFTYDTSLSNAKDLITYLSEYQDYLIADPDIYLAEEYENLIDITESKEVIEKMHQKSLKVENLRKRFPANTPVEGQVIENTDKGLLIDFSLTTGLISKEDRSYNLVKDCERGDWLDLIIKNVDINGNIYLTAK